MGKILSTIFFQVIKIIPLLGREFERQGDVKSLKDVVCYNQCKLANYSFMASEIHKSLKFKYNEAINNKTPENIQKLEEESENLTNFLDDEFKNIVLENFKYLLDFLSSKKISSKKPRACIKAIEDSKTITLIRDRVPCFEDTDYPINANTAFQHIRKTGQYYICNNIPQYIIKGDDYKNARIRTDSVRRGYKNPNIIDRLKFRFTDKIDVKWQTYWYEVDTIFDEKKSPPIDTCYKSTLVIPMTLINSKEFLDKSFLKHFNIDGEQSIKTSFGFLCLDHQHCNFFNEDDISLSYIFADILSLYLIQRLTFTTYSTTYKKCQDIIEENKTSA